ncbi:CoA transferase [Rhodococcus sp. KBS0724]|uniref:CaiB/BaiF CoA transferase family protein n=1 Tax=Rhodococcus sp. KBS0724 TaxID=1179674 RepID=UPI00110EFC09|nr:CaiB/BaiF CoA-transferase family protein [Rhodococcus sp. KBS0724]TSD40404.1 CoA transferase [Rhodococcus sp. KBS0724]
MTNSDPHSGAATPGSRLPLDGVRVLDLSSNAPGPFCTMVLADLGADIVVVDRPPVASELGAQVSIPNAQVDGLARPHFDAFARNKRRIGVNIKKDGGADIIRSLAARSDVVLIEMRPGKAEAAGIGYSDLSALNRGLIYCSITGFGQNGPYRNRPGHDVNYLGYSGALSLFARRDAVPPPPPNMIADYGAAGLLAATSILAALQARHVTGEGQFVDISMLDATTYLLAEWMSTTFDPMGDPTVLADYPPYDVYTCGDGRLITVGCVEPRFWTTLCEVIERPELVALAGDVTRRTELRTELQRTFERKTVTEWLDLLDPHDLPVGAVNSLDELEDDPQIQARDMVTTLSSEHGPVRQVGIGPKLSATPGSIRRLGVPLGADSDEILDELGYSAATVGQLRGAGTVFG